MPGSRTDPSSCPLPLLVAALLATDLRGLASLLHCNGDLDLWNGAELTIASCGFPDLDGFVLTGGCQTLTIRECPQLQSLDGLALPDAMDGLTISGNPALTSLDGVSGLTTLGTLVITGNTALGDPVAEAFANALQIAGLVIIEGNQP